MSPGITRRRFLGTALAGGAGAVLAACSSGSSSGSGASSTGGSSAGSASGPVLRRPGSLPYPNLAPGTDTIPQIDHVVVVMMENHSFDNVLGTLGRGDGFRLDAEGRPTAANPDGHGNLVRAFRMPTPCQLDSKPSQSWNATHIQYADGAMDGFVRSDSGPVAMGYWTEQDLPYTHGLARTFPLADRYFSSCMAQTYPNRRFLLAGTALGLISDPAPTTVRPPNGTIFEYLDAHQVSWRNYYSLLPSADLFPYLVTQPADKARLVNIEQFYSDAAAGTLPGFSLVDPDYVHESEENPQDIQFGEQFSARVVDAVLSSPAWPKTLLVWCYDEHGGYYDHVPPPPAVKPDSIPPEITVPPDQPGAYDRYGMRVPCVVVSPYSRPGYVSHVVHDHTSILKLLQTKWNLPAMTYRDANASNLLDMVDLHGAPRFLSPPRLPAAPDPALRASCQTTGAGTIPPAGAVTRA